MDKGENNCVVIIFPEGNEHSEKVIVFNVQQDEM